MSKLFCFAIEGPKKTFIGYCERDNFDKIKDYLHCMAEGWMYCDQHVIDNMGVIAHWQYVALFFENFTEDSVMLHMPPCNFKTEGACNDFKLGMLLEQARYVRSEENKKK